MHLLISLIIGFCTSMEPPSGSTYVLGFSLADVGPDHAGSLFIYKIHEGRVEDSRVLREQAFIRQALGMESTAANPLSEDLFIAHGINNCSGRSDTGSEIPQCQPIKELWKLRYGGNSLGDPNSGWSQLPNMPSERQQQILQAYRHPDEHHWLGPYCGEQAFRLLKDMQDPVWVENYTQGR